MLPGEINIVHCERSAARAGCAGLEQTRGRNLAADISKLRLLDVLPILLRKPLPDSSARDPPYRRAGARPAPRLHHTAEIETDIPQPARCVALRPIFTFWSLSRSASPGCSTGWKSRSPARCRGELMQRSGARPDKLAGRARRQLLSRAARSRRFGFGWLTDRLGRKKLFSVTLAVYLAATAATGLSWDAWSFIAFRFLTGAGIGGEYTAINSTIQELIPARLRGWTDLLINGSFWIGAAMGAGGSIVLLDPAFIDPALGWRLAFLIGTSDRTRHSGHAALDSGKPALADDPRSRARGRRGRARDRGALRRPPSSQIRGPAEGAVCACATTRRLREVARTLFHDLSASAPSSASH